VISNPSYKMCVPLKKAIVLMALLRAGHFFTVWLFWIRFSYTQSIQNVTCIAHSISTSPCTITLTSPNSTTIWYITSVTHETTSLPNISKIIISKWTSESSIGRIIEVWTGNYKANVQVYYINIYIGTWIILLAILFTSSWHCFVIVSQFWE